MSSSPVLAILPSHDAGLRRVLDALLTALALPTNGELLEALPSLAAAISEAGTGADMATLRTVATWRGLAADAVNDALMDGVGNALGVPR